MGIFGFPFLGAVKDNFDAQTIRQEQPALYETYKISDRSFFGWHYDSIKAGDVLKHPELSSDVQADLAQKVSQSARRTLRVAAVLPLIMAIAFGLMIIGFRLKGGYKPIRLVEDSNS